MVGVVVAKDLPAEPSEQEFRVDLEAMETEVVQHAGIIDLYGMRGVGKISISNFLEGRQYKLHAWLYNPTSGGDVQDWAHTIHCLRE